MCRVKAPISLATFSPLVDQVVCWEVSLREFKVESGRNLINYQTFTICMFIPTKDSLGCRTTILIILFPLKLQTINFTEPFYAPPVVLVTPKHSDNNNNSNLSGSRCNAVTTWVEVRDTLRENLVHPEEWRGVYAVYFVWCVAKDVDMSLIFTTTTSRPNLNLLLYCSSSNNFGGITRVRNVCFILFLLFSIHRQLMHRSV